MSDDARPLTDEERAELESLRAEKAQRENARRIQAERIELERLKATLVRRPKRAEVPVTCDVQMVVEHYSR